MNISKAERTRALRYKRPALQTLGFDVIQSELEEISEACDNVAYFIGDQDALLDAFDGNDEEAYEFRFAFSELSTKCVELSDTCRMDEAIRDFAVSPIPLREWKIFLNPAAFLKDDEKARRQ